VPVYEWLEAILPPLLCVCTKKSLGDLYLYYACFQPFRSLYHPTQCMQRSSTKIVEKLYFFLFLFLFHCSFMHLYFCFFAYNFLLLPSFFFFSFIYYHLLRNLQIPNSLPSLDIIQSEFSSLSLSKTWHTCYFYICSFN